MTGPEEDIMESNKPNRRWNDYDKERLAILKKRWAIQNITYQIGLKKIEREELERDLTRVVNYENK